MKTSDTTASRGPVAAPSSRCAARSAALHPAVAALMEICSGVFAFCLAAAAAAFCRHFAESAGLGAHKNPSRRLTPAAQARHNGMSSYSNVRPIGLIKISRFGRLPGAVSGLGHAWGLNLPKLEERRISWPAVTCISTTPPRPRFNCPREVAGTVFAGFHRQPAPGGINPTKETGNKQRAATPGTLTAAYRHCGRKCPRQGEYARAFLAAGFVCLVRMRPESTIRAHARRSARAGV